MRLTLEQEGRMVCTPIRTIQCEFCVAEHLGTRNPASLRSLRSQSVTLRRIKTPFILWSIEGINFDRIALKHIEAKHPKVPIWYIRATVREPELIIKLNGNWKYYRRLLDSDKYLCVVLYMKYGKGRVKTAYIVEKP